MEDEIDIADLIPVDDMVVTLTHFGYVKRVSVSAYRAQLRGGKGVSGMTTREEDYAEQLYVVNSHDDLAFYSDRGRVYFLKCYQIPEAGRTARGTAIVNILQLSGGEKITSMVPIPEEGRGAQTLIMATRLGMIKKTLLSEFRSQRKAGLIAISLQDDDTLIDVALTNGGQKLLLATRKGKAICFDEAGVRTTGRAAMGVRSMRLMPDDEVISMCLVEEESQILGITSLGYGKRTPYGEYPVQGRGGRGVIAMRLTEKTGDLAKMLAVKQDETC